MQLFLAIGKPVPVMITTYSLFAQLSVDLGIG